VNGQGNPGVNISYPDPHPAKPGTLVPGKGTRLDGSRVTRGVKGMIPLIPLQFLGLALKTSTLGIVSFFKTPT